MVQFEDKTKRGREKGPERARKEALPERFPEDKEEIERKELSEKEKEEREELKKEIEKVKLPQEKRMEAQKEADTLREKSAEGKVSHLLDLAQSKGIAFADKAARETKDPLIVDLFHDTLAKNGQYKKFPK